MILQRLLGLPAERRNALSDDSIAVFTGRSTAVTPGTSVQLATVFSCVRVLAESVAMLPLQLYETAGRSRSIAKTHPLYQVLHSLWNPEITSAEARMALMYWLALYGNGYAQIIRDRAGRVRELWPLAADRMTVGRSATNALTYSYRTDAGKPRIFAQADIMHIRGLSTDGLVGLSPISTARRTFARSQARSAYDEAFYANGARPGGVLKHPGKLSDNAYTRLRTSWEERHQGAENAGKVAILEEGMDYAAIGIPQADQQFLEMQKYDSNQTAAIFRVPSHMINDLERATFANIAEKGQEFVDYTLAPWFVVWEQAMMRDLLTLPERDRYYVRFTVQGLLRGNPTERSQFYSTGLQWGYFSINDVRELEDLNPIANGDEYFVPMNMAPLDLVLAGGTATTTTPADSQQRSLPHAAGCTCGRDHGQRSAKRADTEDETETLRGNRVEMAYAFRPVLEDAMRRLTRREVRDVRRQVDKLLAAGAVADFRAWLAGFYGEDWSPVVADVLKAPMLSYARQAMLAAAAELGEKPKGLIDSLREFVGSYLTSTGNGWAASSRGQLEALIDEAQAAGADPVPAVSTRLDGWEETKPGKLADRHAFEGLNAFVVQSYIAYGIEETRWVASGESCPYCRALNGKIVGIEQFVLGEGDSVDAGDGSPPMLVRHAKRHAPLHGGCDCITLAVRKT